jgi:hypothetical protein
MNELPILYALSVGVIITACLEQMSGIAVTKYSSASLRSVVILSRTPLVWFCSVLFSWEKFIPQQIIAYLLLVLGSLIYVEAIVLPCDSLNENTSEKIIKR